MSPVASAHNLMLPDSTLRDCAATIASSLGVVADAAERVVELLTMAGFAGTIGDTADDLKQALEAHGQLVREFNVKVRTERGTSTFNTQAVTASSAFQAAEERHGDEPCGITVTPMQVRG